MTPPLLRASVASARRCLAHAAIQLQQVEAPGPPAPDETLARITDPRARELYRKKVELGVDRDPFTMPAGVR